MSERSRGVDFFVKRDGRWQAVYSQMTTVEEQAALHRPAAVTRRGAT